MKNRSPEHGCQFTWRSACTFSPLKTKKNCDDLTLATGPAHPSQEIYQSNLPNLSQNKILQLLTLASTVRTGVHISFPRPCTVPYFAGVDRAVGRLRHMNQRLFLISPLTNSKLVYNKTFFHNVPQQDFRVRDKKV